MDSYESASRERQLEDRERQYNITKLGAKIGFGALALLLLLIGGCMWGMPQYNLYKANTQKRERIAEARAEADAEQYRAEAEVRRSEREAERDRIQADAVADSNRIIGESITPEYLNWLWFTNIAEAEGDETIIYVPMNPNGTPSIPNTEAGRAVNNG